MNYLADTLDEVSRVEPKNFPADLPERLMTMRRSEFLALENNHVAFMCHTSGFAEAAPGRRLIGIQWHPQWLHKESHAQKRQKELATALAQKLGHHLPPLLAALQELDPKQDDAYFNIPSDEDQTAVEDWFKQHFKVITYWRNSSPGISFVVEGGAKTKEAS